MKLLLLVHPVWAICNWPAREQRTTLHNYFATLQDAIAKHDGHTVVTHADCPLYTSNGYPNSNKVVDLFLAALYTEPTRVTVIRDQGNGKELCKAHRFKKYTAVTIGGGYIELCVRNTHAEVGRHTEAVARIDPTLCFKATHADPRTNPDIQALLIPGRALWEPF